MAQVQTLDGLSLDEIATLFTRGFEGYFVPLEVDGEALARMNHVEMVDTAASLMINDAGEPVALALIARRERQSRLAAMGVVREARRRGFGAMLVDAVVNASRERGDRSIRLECLEKNEAALALYANKGFRTRRRLVGYEAAPGSLAEFDAELEEVTVSSIAETIRDAEAELPWQIDARRIARYRGPAIGVRTDRAAAVIDTRGSRVSFLALWVEPELRRRGGGRELVGAIATRYPESTLAFPPILPEGLFCSFFRAVGFAQSELSQVEMVLEHQPNN